MSRTLHIQYRTAEDGPWYDEPALCMANSEQSFALAILDAAQAWATEHRPKLQYRLVARLTSNHEIPRAFSSPPSGAAHGGAPAQTGEEPR